MPKIGMCKSGGWHVILVAAAAFFAMTAVEPVLICASTAQAQSGAIREIQVAGNRRVEPETVRSYLKFNVGDAYDPGKVDQSIKALFATGLFADVRIDREGTGVLITVVENPVINQVAFEGNREADKDTLAAEVQLKPRAVFTRARAQADVQRILDVYRRQGRFAASVDPKLIELDDNRVNVVFEINEGAATKVKAINFIGNRAFSDSQLRDIITTTQSNLFDFIKGTNIYDPDRLSLDRELLRQYYLKNGYADARIVSAGAELDRDGSGFYITFVLDEGEVYKFGAVEVESALAGVDANALRGQVLTVSGATFNQSQMDKTVEKLTLSVSEQGFAFARVRPRAARDPGARLINVTYVADEGPRIYIERINVIGNLRTRDYVIRREFRLAEGDAYNALMVDKAKKRLQVLGFFKTVEIKRRPGSAPDRVILEVEVVEQSTGELSFGAGYSTSEGVIGDITISERNLLGRGQFLRLRLAGSAERLQIDLSFTEPRFLDRNLAAGFDVFHKITTVSDLPAVQRAHDRRLVAARLPDRGEPVADELLHPLQQRDLGRAADGVAGDQGGGAANIGRPRVGTSLSYDARNHPKNPTSGYFLTAGAEFAGRRRRRSVCPRAAPEGRFYYPVTEKITFVGRVDRRPHRGLGRPGRPPAGPLLQGWRDHPRLLHGGLRSARHADGRRAGRRYVLVDDGGGALPVPADPRRPRHERRGLRRRRIAVRGRRQRQEALRTPARQLWRPRRSTSIPTPAHVLNTGICLANSAAIRASVGLRHPVELSARTAAPRHRQGHIKESYDKEQLIRFGASTRF